MRPLIVYLAGVGWADVEAADRRLVTALSSSVDVIWVDPVISVLRAGTARRRPWSAGLVAPGVTRVVVLGPPGVTRLMIRSLASRLQSRGVRKAVVRHLAGTSGAVAAVVVASPLGRFPDLPGACRVLHVTDDWPAGASLMGLSASWVQRRESVLARAADLVTAVSPHLADRLSARRRVAVRVLANGCTVPQQVAADRQRPWPVVVGQINERTDLAVLEAVVEQTGVLRIIGPLTARDSAFVARFHELAALRGVEWMGQQPASVLPALLEEAAVGLTPYVDNAFNRASFPLKTLEYLAAGVPCVSTRTPSVTWLDTDLVDVADDADAFAAATVRWVAHPASGPEREQRRALAARHTWDARAAQLLHWLELAPAGASGERPTAQASTDVDVSLERSTP